MTGYSKRAPGKQDLALAFPLLLVPPPVYFIDIEC